MKTLSSSYVGNLLMDIGARTSSILFKWPLIWRLHGLFILDTLPRVYLTARPTKPCENDKLFRKWVITDVTHLKITFYEAVAIKYF
jgi:hypothetical protein